MNALLKKLNHKPSTPVTVLHAPAGVEPLLDAWSEEAKGGAHRRVRSG